MRNTVQRNNDKINYTLHNTQYFFLPTQIVRKIGYYHGRGFVGTNANFKYFIPFSTKTKLYCEEDFDIREQKLVYFTCYYYSLGSLVVGFRK